MKDLEPSVVAAIDTASGEITRAQFLNLFSAVFLPMFLAAIDQTLLATATPSIAAALGGLTDTSWIAIAYLLSSAVVIPLYGRLGDTYGRRNMLLVALGVFSVGSLACGLALSLPQLVAARVMQGLGGGGLIMLCQALIGELIQPRERVKFQAYFAMMFTSASISGPVIGGITVSFLTWRWLFLINLPLAAFAVWRLYNLPSGERYPNSAGTHDVVGIVLFMIATLAGVYWLTSGGHHFSWFSPQSAGLLIVSLSASWALWRNEKRHSAPLLPLDLLRQESIKYSLLTILAFASCMFSLVFFIPIYLQLGHHMSPMHSGLLLLPLTGGLIFGAMTAGRIVARTGKPKIIVVIGMSVSSVALLLLGALPPSTTLVGVLGFFAGTGLGTIMPVNQVTVQTVAGRARLGIVTAMTSLFRAIGAAMGAALFGAVVFGLMPDVDIHSIGFTTELTQNPAITHAFHVAFVMTAAIAAVAAVIAARAPDIRLWPKRGSAQPAAPRVPPEV